MNNILKSQLESLKNIPHSIDGKITEEMPLDFKEIIWSRTSTKDIPQQNPLTMEHTFIFEKYIVKPFVGFDFHDKFNRGVPPPNMVMKGYIIKETDKMYYIDVIGEGNTHWAGWIPKKSVKVM